MLLQSPMSSSCRSFDVFNLHNMKLFVLTLPQSFKIALNKRLIALNQGCLHFFWSEIWSNGFQNSIEHEKAALRFSGFSIWTSFHPKFFSIYLTMGDFKNPSFLTIFQHLFHSLFFKKITFCHFSCILARLKHRMVTK